MGTIAKIGWLAPFALLAIAATLPTPSMAAEAPLGYQLMCLKHPDQCRGGGASEVPATNDIMATLKKVNARVNASIKPRHDAVGTDVWTVDASAGDCEEYALAKRNALIKAGLPASALRLAYVKTSGGESHAVLIVKTSQGDLVLDNLTSSILSLGQSGLQVVSVAGANPTHWS